MASPASNSEASSNLMGLIEHYKALNASESLLNFQSLDDSAILHYLQEAVQSTLTGNFVVDFGDEAAFAAFGLRCSTIEDLCDQERPLGIYARWINIWHPFQHKDVLELLAKQYDFSPRLLALMCSDPRQSRTPTSSQRQQRRPRSFWGKRLTPRSSAETKIEKGDDELAEHSSISSSSSGGDGNLYRIVDDIWHYSSIDLGRSYVCLGYNSLYGTKCHDPPDNADNCNLPHCTRVWTWLILTSDNTVISISENPFPYTNPTSLSDFQQRILFSARRNILNVFRSLSLVNVDPLQARNPMTLLPLRVRVGSTPEETAHRESDTPGLLFYYLFENWHNSYTLITRKESRYGVELSHLRSEMFDTPKLCHIDRLDRIGKELGVLRRHYESYNRLIDRLLEPRAATPASLANSRVVSESSQASLDTVRPIVTEKDSTLGVSLSSAARVRFARLKDLIDLYALSEIEEYLKQKDSLISLNFSLLTLKESLDVERLTRITLLLTKTTILFLPVSLMTGYFSVQLQRTSSSSSPPSFSGPSQQGENNIQYTVAQFWVSFSVILGLSFAALVLFGAFSGSLQTGEVIRGTVKGVRRMGRALRRTWAT